MLAALLLSLLPQASAPDVVVFLIDDVADSDIDAIKTPTLDLLAAEGVRFRRAYTHSWCAPTRDSLLRSHWLGIDRGAAQGPPTENTADHGDLTLAKLFGGAGYRTAHFGKWHLGTNPIGPWEMTPHLSGFDDVRAASPTPNGGTGGWTRLDDGVLSTETQHTTAAVRDGLSEWWQEHEGSPRFALVNWLGAHSPFRVPPPELLYPWVQPSFSPTNREAFEAEVIAVDYVIGQLLPILGPDTWIVFLGDNGTPGRVPNRPLNRTSAVRPDQSPDRVKLTCYEDGVRVPLLVRGPGLPAGAETQALVHAVDLLPTLADLLGLPTPEAIDGESFAAALEDPADPGREFVFVHSPLPRLDTALITPRWKLLTDPEGREELYDLELDPEEADPLPPVGPVARRLRELRDGIRVVPRHLDQRADRPR